MLRSKKAFVAVASLALAASTLVAGAARAGAPLVTYTWTTTSEGFGQQVGEPSSATFQVPLSDVLAGVIPQFDVTNIQLTYPGISFDTAETSSIGFDFAAYVDPTTGAFIFKDDSQGFAVIALDSTDLTFSTFLSILVDNPSGGVVADQFNALNHGTPEAGFPTAGFWTASFPTVTGGGGSGTPEPASWALMILGFGAAGAMMRPAAQAGVLSPSRSPGSAPRPRGGIGRRARPAPGSACGLRRGSDRRRPIPSPAARPRRRPPSLT